MMDNDSLQKLSLRYWAFQWKDIIVLAFTSLSAQSFGL